MERIDLKTVPREQAVARAVTVLQSGGVIAAPTETVYGLMTLWTNGSGRRRIFELKQRSSDKRLQMLAGSLEDAHEAGVVDEPALKSLAARFWPGPLTAVCPAVDGSTIGLRIPAHGDLLSILRQLDDVLAATSANLSGQPPALDADEAVHNLVGEPDLLLDGGRLPEDAGRASTVVDLTGDEARLLRAGPIAFRDIRVAWVQQRRGGC